MLSRGALHRTLGTPTQDEDTGREEPAWVEVYVNLPMRLRSRAAATGTRSVTTAGVEMQLAVMEAHFPADTDDLRDGDLIEVTEGERAGTVWRIVEASAGDQQTARRVPVVEAQRPSEWS